MFLGLASFVVWTQGGFAEQTGPLILYAVNLVLNLAWMPVSLSSGLLFRAICSIFLHGNHLLCLCKPYHFAGVIDVPVVQIFFNQKNFQMAQIDNLGKCLFNLMLASKQCLLQYQRSGDLHCGEFFVTCL